MADGQPQRDIGQSKGNHHANQPRTVSTLGRAALVNEHTDNGVIDGVPHAGDQHDGTDDRGVEPHHHVEIEKQIHNGVKAITSGISLPELTQEIDRLRQRKLDLETIITAKNSSMAQKCSAKEIEESLKLLSQNFDSKTAVRMLVQKIYANTDGSCTVHIGVHIHGAGGRTRTDTVSLPMDFESITSANSITPANFLLPN